MSMSDASIPEETPAPGAAVEPSAPVSRGLGVLNTLVILSAGVVLLWAFLGFHATLREHEVYAAQPAREMLDGGSIVLQPFAGAYRVKKPPGQSWLIAASLAVTGTRNEFTARLPSAIAGTLTALLIASLGARLAGRRVGLIAGLMTLTCYAVQVRARLAEADMALAFCALLANFVLLRALLRSSIPTELGNGLSGGALLIRGLVYWLAIVAGFVIKGPIILLFTLLPAVVFLLGTRFWRRDEASFHIVRQIALNPWASGLALLAIVGWIGLAMLAHPQALSAWWHELFLREREKGADPFYLYAGYVPMALLPWTPFILAGFGRWRTHLRSPAGLLLVLWVMCGGVAISLVSFKRMHYALPLLPPLLLLAARGFDALLTQFVSKRPEAIRPRLGRQLIMGWFVVVGAGWLVNHIVFEPRDRGDRAVKPFAAQVNQQVTATEPIYFVGVGEERTAWYLDRRLIQTRLMENDSIQSQLSRLPTDRASYVLCRVPHIALIAEQVGVTELLRSDDYRGRGEDQERRALLRVQPAAIGTGPTTAPSAEGPG